MGQYLERYLAGDCQLVWDEPLTQGEAIRHEPLANDAVAVAHETMRRVRHNIELLISRLHTLGYRFGEIQQEPHYASERWERDFVQAYPVFQPPLPDSARVLDDLEERVGVLPLSIRTFYLHIGGVNFIGTLSLLSHVINYDPLFIYPLAEVRAEEVEDEEDEDESLPKEEGGTALLLSPDALVKYNESGGEPSFMRVPNASIDGVFHDGYYEVTFVEYLRISLRSGGLTDLEQTEHIANAANAWALLRQEPAPTSATIDEYVRTVENVLNYLRRDLLPI